MKRKLGPFYDPLKAKFINLCVKKHVETNFYLSSISAKKILAKICPNLTGIIIDVLISSVGRLNFENFIALLEKTAAKVKVEVELFYTQVIAYET